MREATTSRMATADMQALVARLQIPPPTTPRARLQALLVRMNRYEQPGRAAMLVGFLIAVGTSMMVGMLFL